MTEILHIPGLERPAEILVDRWGIPHIRAATEADLFFAQGFNAARDRLWQIDLWRKRGLGLLAADFGPGYLAQDHAARHFLYRGDMEAEWAAYAPDARAICTAFAAGINAYVDLCLSEPALLPPEFALFETRPAPWQPEDVVRIRIHALSRNGLSEILRAVVTARAGAEVDLLRASLKPPVAPGPAPEVPLQALRLLKLAAAPATFEPGRLQATLADAWNWVEVTDLGDIVAATLEEGSNAWTVHGSRTATGRPILASDPHRAQAVPSLRYLVHLTAPGFDVIGCGEPCAPGVSLGHNGRTAFGLTIFPADQEDVHLYRTRHDAPDQYRYGDGWERLRRIDETFGVRGHADQALTLSFTRHGPVLAEDRERGSLVAFRSVWSEPGTCAYLGSLAAMRAASVEAFGTALAGWGTPSVNQVCADTAGNIGRFAAGLVPVRRNWHGLMPVPGDGSHEWQGFQAGSDLPRAVNPAAGFLFTANEMNLPPDRAPDAATIGHEWAEDSRALRIGAVLAADPAHSLAAAAALQMDLWSHPAQRICALLAAAGHRSGSGGGLARQAVGFLDGWDHRLGPDSGPAALFELWWMKHLKPALMARFCPDPDLRSLLAPGDFETLLGLLERPEAGPLTWTASQRDGLMLATLAAAFADCRARLGAPATWAWGRFHHAFFEHAAGRLGHSAGPGWSVGPLALGGSRSTVMNAGYRLTDFRVTHGASVRLLIDVGAWDNSRCINTPGQSGNPASAHYSDLAAPWAEGGTVPLLYSGERIEMETVHRIRLLPKA
jgi:penicillin amidase